MDYGLTDNRSILHFEFGSLPIAVTGCVHFEPGSYIYIYKGINGTRYSLPYPQIVTSRADCVTGNPTVVYVVENPKQRPFIRLSFRLWYVL